MMEIPKHFQLHGLAVLALGLAAPSAIRAVERPENLVIVGDSTGSTDPGCSGSASGTANLDALAGRGLRFNLWIPPCADPAYQPEHCCVATTVAEHAQVPVLNPLPPGKASAQRPSAKGGRKKAADPLAPVEDDPKLPRVLLIGDSISIGYTLPVRALLAGQANVHRPPTNGGPTTNGLRHLAAWLGDGKWDVIHFNWGLHDLKYVGPKGDAIAEPGSEGSRQQVPIDAYEENLRVLVQRLRETGAKLVWGSTTPVPKGAKGRVPGDEVRYNEAAARVMEANGIPVHDLHAFARPRLATLQQRADVHFTPEGSRQLAVAVAEAIAARLGK